MNQDSNSFTIQLLMAIVVEFVKSFVFYIGSRIGRKFTKYFWNRGLSKEAREIVEAFEKYSFPYLQHPEIYIKGIGNIHRSEVEKIQRLWKDGINALLLVGNAGSGKSGVAIGVARELREKGIPVLFVPASSLMPNQDPAQLIKERWTVSFSLGEAFTILGKEKECVFIVDQLDTITGTSALAGFTSLLKAISVIQGVRVLAVSRSIEANEVKEISELGFSEIESHELDSKKAKIFLEKIGVTNPTGELIELAQNLLNLSIIAAVYASGNVIEGEVDLMRLWQLYLDSVLKRERAGSQSINYVIKLADENLSKGQREFSIPISKWELVIRLRSIGLLVQLSLGRYRFRHQQIQDFLCAYNVFPERPVPISIIQKYGPYNGKNVLNWLHGLYQLKDSDAEPTFVASMLTNTEIQYYTRVIVLDNLKNRKAPTLELAQTLTEFFSSDKSYSYESYFFNDLQNHNWAGLFQRTKFFLHPPEPIEVKVGSFQLPGWYAGKYLIRIADKCREVVLDTAIHIYTENPRVIEDIIDCLLKIPPEFSAQSVTAVSAWINTKFYNWIPEKIGELMEYLSISNFHREALILLDQLVAPMPMPHSEISRYFLPEIKPKVDYFGFDEVMKKYLPSLISSNPLGVIGVFEERLQQLISFEQEANGEEPGSPNQNYWRNGIGNADDFSGRRNSLKDWLVDGLRDALAKSAEKEPREAGEILERYSKNVHAIFRRLSIFTLRKYGQQYSSLVSSLFQTKELLYDRWVQTEFLGLMRDCFDVLSESERSHYISWILEGPQDLDERVARYIQNLEEKVDEEVVRRIEYDKWLYWKLWVIRDFLTKEQQGNLDSIVERNGQPSRIDETPIISVEWGRGSYCPIPIDSLRKMTVAELVSTLKSFEPATHSFNDSYEMLAEGMKILVIENPQLYASNAPLFAEKELKPIFQSSFLNTLREIINKQIPISVEPIITFAEIITQRINNPFENEEILYESGLVAVGIANFLTDYFQISKLPYLDQSWNEYFELILTRLLNHSDPTPESEIGEKDPVLKSLNCVRGMALHCLVQYALYLNRKAKAEQGVEPPTRKLNDFLQRFFEEKLDIEKEPSIAVHSVFGQYLVQFFFLDHEWTTINISRFFPDEDEKNKFWLSAWDAYISFSDLYMDVFHLMIPQYQRALGLLNELEQKERPVGRVSTERLPEHIISAYVDGLIDFESDDHLFRTFFENASDNTRAHAVFVLSKIFEARKPVMDSELWKKILKLWIWRLDIAESSDQRQEYEGEISDYMRLLSYVPIDLLDLYSVLHRTIYFFSGNFNSGLMFKFVGRNCEKYPLEAVSLLLEMNLCGEKILFIREEDIRSILMAAIHSGKPEPIEKAITFINSRGSDNDHRWAYLLPTTVIPLPKTM